MPHSSTVGFHRRMSQSEKSTAPFGRIWAAQPYRTRRSAHGRRRRHHPFGTDDDELVLQMHDDLYDGLKEEIEEGVNILLERGWTPYDVLTKALVAGMTIVGADFRDGILFVPEVLLAANAMKAGMASSSRCWWKPARRAWARW
jgi:cobalamin-dependent methionine synthase I